MNIPVPPGLDRFEIMSIEQFAHWVHVPVAVVTQWAIDSEIPIVTIGEDQTPFVNMTLFRSWLLGDTL